MTAESAKIPIRDRICCRIGNADDQEHSISSFLLEMKETAFICSNATDRSLILIDELGRATSNEDGVAIAWSTSEYLLKKRSMTFFVTHYPQLSSLAGIYPCVQNIHLEASVTRGDIGEINYTHKAKPGACSVSTHYGVELAAACGWPAGVVENARAIQEQVEALLPDESLCHPHSQDRVPDARTNAYKLLGTISQELHGLIADERPQTFASIRAELSRMKEKHVSFAETDLISAVDQLLFRESLCPRAWARHNRTGEEHDDDFQPVPAVDVNSGAFAAKPNNSSYGGDNLLRVSAGTEVTSCLDNSRDYSDSSASESNGSGDKDSSTSSSEGDCR